MDCSYMNQRRSCCRCPQMNSPAVPSMDCGCGEPPTMIPDCPVIEPRMVERPVPNCRSVAGGQTMPAYASMMPMKKNYECPDTGAGCMEQYPVAMGYIPWQQWQQTYTLERSLCRGTIFPDLDLPFVMGRCR